MNHIDNRFCNGDLSHRVNMPNYSSDHPVEVVGRVRDFPDRRDSQPQPAFDMVKGQNGEETTVRVKTDIGYRHFSLDGISVAEKQDLEGFYKNFIENRVYGVKTGGKCTIIMYGPTGSGKSHTMFGCSKEPGIVYRALNHILDDQVNEDGVFRQKLKVKVSVLEIYNEDIFDLLATSNMTHIGWFKNGGSRMKLEVIGKKVKNATSISGTEAGKITKEIARVEKKRVVKTTLLNDRSSRSHCLIMIDVPAVGGRLVLVDMAGSENIDQAGSVGPEAKIQTGKINQGNMALKRVVESIANGDSHVPYRDSKLTMLLQDSFEDDGAKLLMVLCASPDPRDIHKTIGTLEYGAKAKRIVRLPSSPPKENGESLGLQSAVVGTRILAMEEYIMKLQTENKLKEQDREATRKELKRKEVEVAKLRAELENMEEKKRARDEIEFKAEEKARLLKDEIERKCEEYQRKANDCIERGRMMMEKQFLQHQEEVETLTRRLGEIESELEYLRRKLRPGTLEEGTENASKEIEIIPETCLIRTIEQVATESKVLQEVEPCNMSISTEINRQRKSNYNESEGANQLNSNHGVTCNDKNGLLDLQNPRHLHGGNPEGSLSGKDEDDDLIKSTRLLSKGWLPTANEEGESVEEVTKTVSDKETTLDDSKHLDLTDFDKRSKGRHFQEELEKLKSLERYVTDERRKFIENIFFLCGNYRELAARSRIEATKENMEASQTSKLVLDETEKDLGTEASTTPIRSTSNNSPIHSPNLPRSTGKARSVRISLPRESTSKSPVTLSPSMSSRDSMSGKRLQYGHELLDSNLNISTGEPEVAQDSLKERLQTTGSTNGLGPGSRLTDITSITNNCYKEIPKRHNNDAAATESPDNKENEFQQLQGRYCDVYVNKGAADTESTDNKENEFQQQQGRDCDVYVKWETPNEVTGKLIGILRIAKDAFLKDLRKMIEPVAMQDFIFLVLRDPSGAPIARENEASFPVTSLPSLPNQQGSRLACLRLCNQQVTATYPCSPEEPLGSPKDQLPVSAAPVNTAVQASPSSPWVSPAQKKVSKTSNQSASSPGN